MSYFKPENIHPEDTLWGVVLNLASLHTGTAAETAVQIDDHSIFDGAVRNCLRLRHL
jgi:hypothetical protein